jgi:hypothetical protein
MRTGTQNASTITSSSYYLWDFITLFKSVSSFPIVRKPLQCRPAQRLLRQSQARLSGYQITQIRDDQKNTTFSALHHSALHHSGGKKHFCLCISAHREEVHIRSALKSTVHECRHDAQQGNEDDHTAAHNSAC